MMLEKTERESTKFKEPVSKLVDPVSGTISCWELSSSKRVLDPSNTVEESILFFKPMKFYQIALEVELNEPANA